MKIGNFNINNASIDIRKAVVFTKTYSIFILLFSLFSSGLITGTLTVRNSEYCRYLLSVFSVDGKGFAVIFINLFFPVILTLTLNFIMGLCLVGTPFIYFSSVIEGIYISLGYAYHIYTDGYSNFGRFLLTDIIFFIFIFVIFILSNEFIFKTSQINLFVEKNME